MLYIVATPIGNLKDITLRALEVLEQVDVIACEDTRKSSTLLNTYNIKKPLISYHKFSEQKASQQIIDIIKQGKSVALISDSGMPVISDPGHVLISKMKAESLPYTVLPGATALISALVLSGFDSSGFVFLGFLPETNKQRKLVMESVKNLKMTLIFYVSPHKIERDLKFLYSKLGARKACFVKEITKIHETVYDFVLGDEIELNTKGEFVLMVSGAEKVASQSDLVLNKEELTKQLNKLVSGGINEKAALKLLAEKHNVKKQEVYKILKVK